MDTPPLPRRRSPQWVRDLDSRVIHSIAWRFNQERVSADLTEAQEWLWSALISELEYRNRSALHVFQRCSCELCIPPFEEWLPPEP